jgi:septal ring-binding cell division protein DamX
MKKNNIYLFVILFFSWAIPANGQEVQLNEDSGVSKVMSAWISQNRANPRISGWRVQIMASTDRQQIEDGYSRFRVQNPDVAASWVQEKPYYKLRVGAFRSKQEALAFIATLTDYAGAYPAKDAAIHPRDFLEQ